ncbi:11320_t:CDS:2, partial [Acaulospora morrowiae]
MYLTWLRNHLSNLKPEDYYKKLGYSHNLRSHAEEKLHKMLKLIIKENYIINRKKATNFLNNFVVNENITASSMDTFIRVRDVLVEASFGKLTHEVVGRNSAYKTIKNVTKKIYYKTEVLNEFQPPSKRLKEDKLEQPHTPKDK